MMSSAVMMRLCCLLGAGLLASAVESSSSSSSLELTLPSSEGDNHEFIAAPINFGFLATRDNNDVEDSMLDSIMTRDAMPSSIASSSASLESLPTNADTTTTTTTSPNLEMIEFWPFHRKNKTFDNHTEPASRNKTRDETCAAQHGCSACAVHSHMCHWCAHDNACHSIGSIYGCITGVNCFSNDRCKRDKPVSIYKVPSMQYAKMKIVPMIVALVVAGMAFLCVTFGYCLACGIKGAYDDLAEIAAMESHPFVIPVHAFTTVDASMTQPHVPTTTRAAARAAATTTTTATTDSEQDVDALLEEGEGQVPLDTAAGMNSQANYTRMPEEEDEDDEEAETSPLLLTSQVPKNRRIPRHMQRCFNACTLCYVVTVAILGTFVFGTVHYYPRIPEYSVCSDQVAWKSLIDSIAAIKVDASFEILVSVANPNVVDAVLDLGKGTFKHNNAFVGTFEIPPARVPAMSISDLMIIARFTPEKYEALAIVEEYYRGKLILHIDAQASIRVPFAFNYTYEVDVKDMIVNANEKDDRSLCKCPTWDDLRNNTNAKALEVVPSMLLMLPSS